MKILIASGGSGGHIFPAISLARKLESNSREIVFVASKRNLDRDILKDTPYKKIFLSINPMPHKAGLGSIVFLFKLFSDMVSSFFILLREKPNVVVGFGGYTAGAILLSASKMKIKTVIHEQNLVPGRTNRFLDGRVSEVAVSFDETKKYFKNENTHLTGNPLREESLKECREESLKVFDLEKGKLTILVMGGSQGAHSLNELVINSLKILPSDKKNKIQLVHITGPKDEERIRGFYLENSINSKVFGFMKNINEAYSACDIAISRSGAAAVFELAAFKKPMILIPYPSQKNNQRFNAQFFQEHGAAIYKDEKRLDIEKLRDIIADLIDNEDRRRALAHHVAKLSIVDGAERLKEVVLK